MIKNFCNLLLFMAIMLAGMIGSGMLVSTVHGAVMGALGGKGIAFCYAAVLFACYLATGPKRKSE